MFDKMFDFKIEPQNVTAAFKYLYNCANYAQTLSSNMINKNIVNDFLACFDSQTKKPVIYSIGELNNCLENLNFTKSVIVRNNCPHIIKAIELVRGVNADNFHEYFPDLNNVNPKNLEKPQAQTTSAFFDSCSDGASASSNEAKEPPKHQTEQAPLLGNASKKKVCCSIL